MYVCYTRHEQSHPLKYVVITYRPTLNENGSVLGVRLSGTRINAPDMVLGIPATFAPTCAVPVSQTAGLSSVKKRKPSKTRRLKRRELSRKSKAEVALVAGEATQLERQAAEDAVRLKQQAEEAAHVERQLAEDAERKKQQAEAEKAVVAAREAEKAVPETKVAQPERVLREFVEFGRTWTHVEYMDKDGAVRERRQCVERDGRTCGICCKSTYLHGKCSQCGFMWAEYEERQDWNELDAARAAGSDIYDEITARNKKRQKRAAVRAQKKNSKC